MIWPALGGVATAELTGYLVVRSLSPTPTNWPQRTIRAGMALVVGVALHSLWHLVWVAGMARGRWTLPYLPFDLALPAVIGAALFVSRRKPSTSSRETPAGPIAWGLPLTTLAACAAGTTLAANFALLQPYGDWDAWAIWNFKARWLALGGTPWSAIATNTVFATAHPDYPLLLPLSVSRLWVLTGGTSVAVPQAFGVCTAALIAALIVAAAWSLRGPTTAAVAGAAFLGVPPFFVASASQMADLPTACCYLATLVAMAMGLARRTGTTGTGGWFALAGITAGAALWTKNEGALFAVCAVVSQLAVAILARVRHRPATDVRIGRFLIGATPFLVAAIALKSMAAGDEFITGQSPAATWERLTTAARHYEVLRHGLILIRGMLDPIGLAFFVGYLCIRGQARDLRPGLVCAMTVALTACGYYVAYVVTPYPLSWHLTTSADRLLIQLWPSVVFVAVLLSREESPADVPDMGFAPARETPLGGSRRD